VTDPALRVIKGVATVIEDAFPIRPQAPAEARKLVRELSLDEPTRQTLELIVSELVTNSVVHGDSSSHRGLALRISCEDANISGEVCGPGSGFEWEEHEPDLSTPGGLGLMLVDNLTERWGIRRNGCTCVWFECVSPPHD
jgi:two-component sensor histidine kinase